MGLRIRGGLMIIAGIPPQSASLVPAGAAAGTGRPAAADPCDFGDSRQLLHGYVLTTVCTFPRGKVQARDLLAISERRRADAYP
jgi:hypothetical protein